MDETRLLMDRNSDRPVKARGAMCAGESLKILASGREEGQRGGEVVERQMRTNAF